MTSILDSFCITNVVIILIDRVSEVCDYVINKNIYLFPLEKNITKKMNFLSLFVFNFFEI